ncbi:MAG: hypothetical protein H6702_17775 [Myxococcales bacterium]|nr:hypothetical protein [Myxococcales bacterium]
MGWVKTLGLGLGLGVGLGGCGASFQTAECQRTYDDCASACADECEDRGAPSENTSPERVNTWTLGCSACEDRCRSQARSCEERAARRVLP